MSKRVFAGAALALLLLAGQGVRALEDSEAAALLERAFANLYADDYVQTLELSTASKSARPMSRTLQITRRQSVRPGKALVRFLEPFDVRRTSVLILENDGASDDLYVFLPALGMTRRLSAAQRADSFFGTDLSYEDIEPKRASEFIVRALPPEDASDADCMRLEIRPREGYESTYERMVSCIEPERAVIRWTDFERHGRFIKRLEADLGSIQQIGSRFIPFLMTMTTLRTGSETQVRTHDYDLAGDIPDRLFSTWNLESGDANRDRTRAGSKGAASN